MRVTDEGRFQGIANAMLEHMHNVHTDVPWSAAAGRELKTFNTTVDN